MGAPIDAKSLGTSLWTGRYGAELKALLYFPWIMLMDKCRIPTSMKTIFAAFPNSSKKSLPITGTTCFTIHAAMTMANTRAGFSLQIRPLSSDGLFSIFKTDPQKKIDKEQEKKISTIRERLAGRGYATIQDEQINYALGSKQADGDVDKAFETVFLFQQSVEGIIKPYDSRVHMLGAENREGVTCYLDALLFAMFSRLGSFEPILYTNFEDEPRRRLAALIRLWVNLLRSGKLIQTDVTGYLQEALAACGWEDAGKLEQQDTSEAFSFITEKLELPLLTLKMDIFHTGKEDDNDDHKFVQERLLEVAVPKESEDGRPIRLEDCLENYFNNQVEVVRRLERSNTRTSTRSALSPYIDEEGGESTHVEVSELPLCAPDTPLSTHTPATPISPDGRDRATSIIRRRIVYDDEKEEKSYYDRVDTPTSIRKGSVRKEVLMPAWQFFNLIRPSPFISTLKRSDNRTCCCSTVLIGETAWYTKHSPANDAEVAAHFSKTRPVLGICLKRYAMTADGYATRKNTFIDIPLDIKLPHFIQEDMVTESGPLMGNFKLSLQSVICHRGISVHSGHYISFVRSTSADGDAESSRRLSNNMHPPHYAEDTWIRFDDLANPRIQKVDIEQAMKDEMPYLLFYQVQPTYDMSGATQEVGPPSYHDSGIGVTISSPASTNPNKHAKDEGYFDGTQDETPSIRLSSECERPVDEPRRSINLPEDRRGSLAFTEMSTTSTASIIISAPVTPGEETAAQRMSRAAARFTKSASKSRPTSQSGENRLSFTLSRLNWRASKEQLISKVEATMENAAGEPATKETATKETPGKAIGTRETPATPDPLSLQTDLPSDSRRASTMIEEVTVKPDEGAPSQNAKKNKKRDRSKGVGDALEHEHHHHHHHKGKEKSKHKEKSKDKEIDRECVMM
ncbi:ubiquitin carboxyl-terminal hydrolase-domain-containing protein [Amylocarpus encephaloides]|uniref:ubiquitinyl hydrolase 1 n=1 Tax=Amylocarpus encephaloides TaxID=45428 RepID=A0A9P8C448_9HELO|nr:ubiquitin carboxyl-terminal hydrolase-domain-containing protein [Amylocarpus encephaloides]